MPFITSSQEQCIGKTCALRSPFDSGHQWDLQSTFQINLQWWQQPDLGFCIRRCHFCCCIWKILAVFCEFQPPSRHQSTRRHGDGRFMPEIPYMPKHNAVHMYDCTVIVCHNWKGTIKTCLPYKHTWNTKNTFSYLISQGTETTSRWGGAAALRGDLPHPPAAGQWLLWKGEQASMFVMLFTSLSNFCFGTDESHIPAHLS